MPKGMILIHIAGFCAIVMPLMQTKSQSDADAFKEAAPATCKVTHPNGAWPPGDPDAGQGYGNDDLWTALWPDGTVVFRPGGPGSVCEDGSMSMKWSWSRGVRGKLSIEGKRLDKTAPPLRVRIPEGYGDIGFQPTGLIFPTEGCREVTGKVADARLTFVTRVVRL